MDQTLVIHLNPLDWLLAALLVYSVVRAALNGFFRAAFNLAGLVLGLPLAFWGYGDLALDLRNLLTSPALAQLVAFVLILSAVALVASLLGRLFRRGARTVGLGFADRLGGAVFGFVRGLLIGAALLLAITAFLPTAPWIQTSQLAPYFLRTAHALSFSMPADLRLRLRDGLDRLRTAGFGKHGTPISWESGPLSQTGARPQPHSSVTARKR